MPADTAQLRPAAPEDGPFLAWGLDEAAGGLFTLMFATRSSTILGRVMAQPGHTYSYEHATVAEVGGRMIGCCQGWPHGTPSGDGALLRAAGIRAIRAVAVGVLGLPALAALDRHAPGEWYLQAIAVEPGARGGGVGQTLFADAASRAGSAGSTALTLDVDAANTRAKALYERLGLAVEATSSRAVLLGGTALHRMSAPLAGLPSTR